MCALWVCVGVDGCVSVCVCVCVECGSEELGEGVGEGEGERERDFLIFEKHFIPKMPKTNQITFSQSIFFFFFLKHSQTEK